MCNKNGLTITKMLFKRKIAMFEITLFDISHFTPTKERRLQDLLPFAQAQLDRRILTCIQQLKIKIEYVTKDQFIDARLHYPARISLFLCAADDLQNHQFQEVFAQYIQKNPNKINLCLLPFSCEVSSLDLIDYFDDFLYWPCSVNELKLRLNKHFASVEESKNTIMSSKHDELISTFSKLNLCGKSRNFLQTLELILKISQHQATVLIQGETGTGKENAARAVHYLGNRAQCPFVPINCATIPDDLLESELFGHEKGAFTDARQSKEGLVAFANGGTLFLDEVDSLSPKAQAALLRFLQTQEYRPVGSKKIMHANVRIIAATNADLKQLASQKLYREDLFFRLNVLNLIMPPLRDRTEDIPVIAESLVKRFSQEYDLPIKLLSQRSLRFLEKQEWPGNVREFENTLLRSFLLSTGKYLEIDDGLVTQVIDNENHKVTESKPDNIMPPSFQDAKALAIESFEKDYLSQVMMISKGNVTTAAKIAGKERRALGKLLQKYDIDKYVYRP
jgi:DNA-binding NtrC family response regulator